MRSSKPMKKFRSFVVKELLHIFRDYRTMIILFGIPVAQILIFGFVITNEIKNVKVAVLDHSNDHMTIALRNKIFSSGYFHFAGMLENEKQVEKSFKSGRVKTVLVFGQDFSGVFHEKKNLPVQIIADASDPNTANLVVSYTQGIIRSYLIEQMQDFEIPLKIDVSVRMLYNEQLKGVYMFVPGAMTMILMLISAMMTSLSIAREKENGTMDMLIISPLHSSEIILGKVAPYVVLSFLNAVIIILLGYVVFGLPVQGSLVLLLLVSLLFIIMALSLGILISTVSPNQIVAMLISMFALMLPTILLSGFIFPLENMPKLLQYLSYLLPPRYFVVILKNIMLKGAGIEFIWKEVLVISGMTLVYLLLSIRKFTKSVNAFGT
jgi:ABC-2 type transport system permease protein